MTPEPARDAARVLVVAPYGRDAAEVEVLLRERGFDAQACPTLAEAAAALDDRTGVVLVTEEALAGGLDALDRALGAQPSWSDVPFVLLAAPHARRQGQGRGRPRLPEAATNVVVLERPLGAASLVSAVSSAVRSRRRQFDMRDRLADLDASRRALQTSEAELRRIADALPMLIAFVDRDCRYRFANRASEAWLGLPPAAVVGRSMRDVLGAAEFAGRREAVEGALAGTATRIERPWPRSDGRRRDVELSYLPRRDASGAVDGFHLFAVDVTERKQAEEVLRRTAGELEELVEARTAELHAAMASRLQAEEALRHSQKLEAVGQLTGGVAHDFNNLLTIIRSSVDLLRRPDLPDERRRRYVDAVSDTVDRAAKLTGQLLAFARRQALKPEVFEAGATLRGLADMLDTVTGARIRVVTDLPDEPCFVRADLSQFETALVNMAVNARDAMDGEGTLTLRMDAGGAMPPIRGHAGAPGPFAAVSLTDTGAGIPPEQLSRIFEPFFTTKEVGKGTGLGLSQVFGFTKQSGGDVAVESAPGRGTTFTLYLPQVERAADAAAAGPEREAGPSPGGAGRRVLVVEDNVEVGRFSTQILQDLGYETTWAPNAEEALERLGADGAGFDVVFSDVVMPGMGGIALAKTLRVRLPALPVVLASGYSHVLAEEGTHGFELLHKPYSAEQLSRALRHATGRRPRLRAPAVTTG